MLNKKVVQLLFASVLLLISMLVAVIYLSQRDKDASENKDDSVVQKDYAPYDLKSSKGVELTINSPEDKNNISCPIKIAGSVTGQWYFEASFGIKVLDSSGIELASGIATTTEDWMTEDQVKFESLIDCTDCTDAKQIVFVKDNPSGLSDLDDKVVLDINVNSSCW